MKKRTSLGGYLMIIHNVLGKAVFCNGFKWNDLSTKCYLLGGNCQKCILVNISIMIKNAR